MQVKIRLICQMVQLLTANKLGQSILLQILGHLRWTLFLILNYPVIIISFTFEVFQLWRELANATKVEPSSRSHQE